MDVQRAATLELPAVAPFEHLFDAGLPQRVVVASRAFLQYHLLKQLADAVVHVQGDQRLTFGQGPIVFPPLKQPAVQRELPLAWSDGEKAIGHPRTAGNGSSLS